MASLDYRNKVVLAPMVRIGTLPTRLLALQYGADIVYCEEIIDHKILIAERIDNTILGTVDYVLSDSTLVFRTHPSEKGKVVFQLGTADAKTALKAAKKIENDVAAIDINMGCPKEFSIKGGMGAALLKKPEKIKEILTTLVQNVKIPVTCKIRLLPELEDNISLVKMIESTGVSAVGIHGRLTEERPRHTNRNSVIKKLAQILTIPVIANGGSKDIQCYDDIEKFRQSCGTTSVMIARAAEWNTSVFRKKGKLPVKDVIKEYLKIAIDMDNGFTNTKYCILMMMHADMDQQEGLDTQDSKCIEEICEIWGMTEYMKEVRMERKKKQEQVDRYLGIKKRKTENGTCLIEMPIRFIKKDYPVSISPKLKLYEWTKRNKVDIPQYDTVERKEDRCYKCVMELDGVKYTSTFWEKSKQLAEQAAAIVGLIVLREDDGRKPGSDSPNDEVIKVWREEFHISHDDAIYKHKSENSGKCYEDFPKSKYRNLDGESSERNGVDSVERLTIKNQSDVSGVTDNSYNLDNKNPIISQKDISNTDMSADKVTPEAAMNR
ncbi:tRNA-dihydrouridine(20) synthase [NAD(P)+]-like [Mercenaria mercenaria]|uniref:tRNA-dihydrouridine(20) synthase [NAD(P)+]-like n=1 Tax=Mercenaria mercenaria TaxID=6596 RepID=UPI00234E7F30|nr:tRNA-dihydrouridine(20) synthase [NAD(P)+]-like [Mercenaria mercenaria]XP_045192612.2 tRNA-dihydrouridine(20) synthase [NAD(P)+]-like [Mercenaria mercenaria]